MEIELKYKIESLEQYKNIMSDSWILSLAENNTPEAVRMKAAYFDTDDRTLIRHNIAFRIRTEGDRTVATLKWRDDDEGIRGLYIRSEINIPVSDKTCYFNPNPSIFMESAEGKDLLDLLEDKKLVNVFDVIFTRKRIRVDYEQSILEIAFDHGVIVAGTESAPLCELEIELYSGVKEDLLAVGKKIEDKYGLIPELKTKFARGVELLDKE